MARPNLPQPPVASAVAVRDQPAGESKYVTLVKAFDREDRKTELLAMFGGDDEAVQRFIAVALHAIATNSDLLRRATVESLIQAVKDSAALGLEPTGLSAEGWIVVYGDQATFQPGWRGYLKRIRNSGQVTDIDCQLVYEADEFEVRFGTNPSITHVPKLFKEADLADDASPRGKYLGAYAIAWMPSGRPEIEWMPTVDIEHIRRTYSRAADKDAWTKAWGEMARKTVIRRLSKRLPQSAVDRLLELDARNDALAAAQSTETETRKLDVSRARAATLAAIAGRGAAPTGAASTPVAPAEDPTVAATATITRPTEDDEFGPFDDPDI